MKTIPNLMIHCIDWNYWEGDKLITLEGHCTLLGYEGIFYVGVDKLDSEIPAYSETEIDSEVATLFNEKLQERETWDGIVALAKEVVDSWNEDHDYFYNPDSPHYK